MRRNPAPGISFASIEFQTPVQVAEQFIECYDLDSVAIDKHLVRPPVQADAIVRGDAAISSDY